MSTDSHDGQSMAPPKRARLRLLRLFLVETPLPVFSLRYVLRIPDSGRTLIDGKPYADAIHNNRDNPNAFGRCVPSRL